MKASEQLRLLIAKNDFKAILPMAEQALHENPNDEELWLEIIELPDYPFFKKYYNLNRLQNLFRKFEPQIKDLEFRWEIVLTRSDLSEDRPISLWILIDFLRQYPDYEPAIQKAFEIIIEDEILRDVREVLEEIAALCQQTRNAARFHLMIAFMEHCNSIDFFREEATKPILYCLEQQALPNIKRAKQINSNLLWKDVEFLYLDYNKEYLLEEIRLIKAQF